MSEAVENRCRSVTPPVTDGPMKILSAKVGRRIPTSLRCGVLSPFLRCLLLPYTTHWRSICCGKGKPSGGSRLLSGNCLGLWELRRKKSHTKLGSWCLGPSHLLSDPFSISGSAWAPPQQPNPLPLASVCSEPSQRTPPPRGPLTPQMHILSRSSPFCLLL